MEEGDFVKIVWKGNSSYYGHFDGDMGIIMDTSILGKSHVHVYVPGRKSTSPLKPYVCYKKRELILGTQEEFYDQHEQLILRWMKYLENKRVKQEEELKREQLEYLTQQLKNKNYEEINPNLYIPYDNGEYSMQETVQYTVDSNTYNITVLND